jgi:hypothetical protein
MKTSYKNETEGQATNVSFPFLAGTPQIQKIREYLLEDYNFGLF